jgi:hypothetical protein
MLGEAGLLGQKRREDVFLGLDNGRPSACKKAFCTRENPLVLTQGMP